MKITAAITKKTPSHSRLSIWVNGRLIVHPSGICLRNEEVVEFFDHLKLPSFHIKEKIREMIQDYKEQEGRMGETLEKQIVLQVVLTWIEDHERKLNVKMDGFWEMQ